VVAFFSDTEVGYAVYDPNSTVRKWDEDWMLMRQIHQMEIGPTGVVAFISNRESGYVVYDPKTRDWAEASRLLGSATDATISVAATGKVSWTYRSGGFTWSESVTYAGNGKWNFPRSE
jgi:hypothetical protein